MNKLLIISAALGLSAIMASCSDDKEIIGDGEGSVVIRTTVNSDVKVESRATAEEALAATCKVWISNSKGAVRKYDASNPVPAGPIALVSDSYIAEAWAGDSVPATFDVDKRYFKGREEFTVTKGQLAHVNLVCHVANVVVSVNYAPEIDEVLSDYELTVKHRAGELTFTGRDDRKGYFMMPSKTTSLTWTLTGTDIKGNAYTKTGELADVKPTTEYKLNVRYVPSSAELGGGMIEVVVDDTPLAEIEEELTIVAAPRINGVGFNIDEPLYSEPGAFGTRSVYVSAAAALTMAKVECDRFMELGLSGNDFDVVSPTYTSTFNEELNNAGIFAYYTYDDVSDVSSLKLTFDEVFTSKMTAGSYSIKFTMTDALGKTTVKTLVIELSEASSMPVALAADAPTTWATEATVQGLILKEGVASAGINYRKKGDVDWITVAADGVPAVGTNYSVKLTGLTPGTAYEFTTVADGVVSQKINTFTTEAALQLKNAGFEEWNTDATPFLLCKSKSDMFWDSGNHGSATMGKNITVPSETIFHSGSRAADLKSQFVGVLSFGKLAAGNMFVGEYLDTEGTDGLIGWGRPFTSRPKGLRGYIKYTPVAVTNANTNPGGMAKGDMDQGSVFVVLLDNTTETVKSDSGKEYTWPIIIRTKEKKFFDKDKANIIAYGEKIFTEATAGAGLVEFYIPLDYRSLDRKAFNIAVVCSASRYGDYFTGGDGSEMIIDDLELVY